MKYNIGDTVSMFVKTSSKNIYRRGFIFEIRSDAVYPYRVSVNGALEIFEEREVDCSNILMIEKNLVALEEKNAQFY